MELVQAFLKASSQDIQDIARLVSQSPQQVEEELERLYGADVTIDDRFLALLTIANSPKAFPHLLRLIAEGAVVTSRELVERFAERFTRNQVATLETVNAIIVWNTVCPRDEEAGELLMRILRMCPPTPLVWGKCLNLFENGYHPVDFQMGDFLGKLISVVESYQVKLAFQVLPSDKLEILGYETLEAVCLYHPSIVASVVEAIVSKTPPPSIESIRRVAERVARFQLDASNTARLIQLFMPYRNDREIERSLQVLLHRASPYSLVNWLHCRDDVWIKYVIQELIRREGVQKTAERIRGVYPLLDGMSQYNVQRAWATLVAKSFQIAIS